MVAGSAMAEMTDVTPAGYDFANGKSIAAVSINPYDEAVAAVGGNSADWNLGAPFAYESFYKDGLVAWIGPQFKGKYAAILEGIREINLGGTVGNVLCIGGLTSNVKDALKAYNGYDYDIPVYGEDAGYIIPNIFADPKVEGNIRVRFVLNIYRNALDEGESVFQPYARRNLGWQPNEDNAAPDRSVFSGNFAMNWGEADAENHQIDYSTAAPEDLELYTPEEGDYGYERVDDNGYVWNPERWMVYEFDTTSEAGDPLMIKCEIPGAISNGTIFIKEIKFFSIDEPEIAPATRRKTYEYYELGDPSQTGISSVVAEASALRANVNGNAVSFNEAAVVYTVSGVKVASVAAGEVATLAKGFYVASANGKAVKFVVK